MFLPDEWDKDEHSYMLVDRLRWPLRDRLYGACSHLLLRKLFTTLRMKGMQASTEPIVYALDDALREEESKLYAL